MAVAGRLLSDFPFVAREWDPANEGVPETTPAGSGSVVGWVCSRDPAHRWLARVADRTSRLTGCDVKQCRRDAADLASVRAAWGPLAHPPETPVVPDGSGDVLAGGDRDVLGKGGNQDCPEYPAARPD